MIGHDIEMVQPAEQSLASRIRSMWDVGAPFAFSLVTVAALGGARGGYFPTAWGWPIALCSLIAAWAASSALPIERSPVFFVAGLLGLSAWTALSGIWGTPSSAILAAARVAVYAVVVGAAWMLTRARPQPLVGGVVAACAALAAYAVTTRILPGRFATFDSLGGYRLTGSIGYWNALGLMCAFAAIAAISLSASARSTRIAGIAALPVPCLICTLYFTFGRGSWIALVVGLAVAVGIDSARLSLTATALGVLCPAGAAVVLAMHSPALTHRGSTLAVASREGHQLAVVLVFTSLIAAGLAGLGCSLRLRWSAPRALVTGYPLALLVLCFVALISGSVALGGPLAAAKKGWSAFSGAPPTVGNDLGKRLLSFSGTGRVELYRVALREVVASPLVGTGGGSYESYWLKDRRIGAKVRNAHSLYLETLAEVGVIGLALLVLALGAPLVGGIRRRTRPGMSGLTGAYAAFLVGAGLDWDWQITSVTVAALLIGVAILASGFNEAGARRTLSRGVRCGVLGTALAIAAFGFVFLVGNMFLSRANAAATSGQWAAAAKDAKRASSWLPWSTDPQRQLGEAQLAQGNTKAAQASFHSAIDKDRTDWNLWLDLARASNGKAQAGALAQATRLNPLSPEITELKTELGSSGGIAIGAKP
jgi:hypothetical protein